MSNQLQNSNAQKVVPAYNKIHQFIQSAEQIGAFSAYVRRPIPSLSGMVAQFFGPNGEDSDSILALSLTKYLDAEVFITVYMIKDANGVVMKKVDGTYPEIAQFMAITRRGVPNRGGMMAQFFATNGADSDAVNDLGKSIYQDCLVFVDIRGKFAKNSPETIESPSELIDQEYVGRVSQHEIKEYQKKEKQFKKMNEQLLLSGFLKQPSVLYALGSQAEYITWSCTRGCCWPTQPSCDNEPVSPYEIKNMVPNFNYLPFCQEHLDVLEGDVASMPLDAATYLPMKNSITVQEWAVLRLREKFSLTGREEPDSYKISLWAKEHNLEQYLPAVFKNIS